MYYEKEVGIQNMLTNKIPKKIQKFFTNHWQGFVIVRALLYFSFCYYQGSVGEWMSMAVVVVVSLCSLVTYCHAKSVKRHVKRDKEEKFVVGGI